MKTCHTSHFPTRASIAYCFACAKEPVVSEELANDAQYELRLRRLSALCRRAEQVGSDMLETRIAQTGVGLIVLCMEKWIEDCRSRFKLVVEALGITLDEIVDHHPQVSLNLLLNSDKI